MKNRTNRLKKCLLAFALGLAGVLAVTGAAEAQEPTITTPDLMDPGELPGPWGTCYGATMLAHKGKCESWGRQDQFGTDPADDPAFCNSECHRCCDQFGGLDGFDQVLLHSSCECLLSSVGAEGVSAFGCVMPTIFSTAKAMGYLTQEEFENLSADPLFLAHILETMDEILEGPQDLAFTYNWLQGLPPHVAAELQAEAVTKMFRGMAGMILASMGICENLDSLMESIFHLECEKQCGDWFYRPSGGGPGGGGGGDGDGGGDGGSGSVGGGGWNGGNPGPGGDDDPFGGHPFNRPCLGEVGRACFIGGHQGVVNDYCDCESVEVTECDPRIYPECAFGGGGSWWNWIPQWY